MLLTAPILFALGTQILFANGQLPVEDDSIRIFPQPTHVTFAADDAKDIILSPDSFIITHTATNNADILDFNINATLKNIFSRTASTQATNDAVPLSALAIELLTDGAPAIPSPTMDESYTINLKTPSAKLSCNEVYGCVRGLETFSQLLQMNRDYVIQQGEDLTIKDAPNFPYRGLMLDPARHFMTVKEIKSTMDAMAQNKLNVLHLHLTDGEAFTINTEEYEKYPDLGAKGSYHKSLTYKKSDLKAIVTRGRMLGIRVIPEVDAPAHMASWAQAYPSLITDCPTENPHPQWPTYYSPADVTNEELYEVLDEIVGSLAEVFLDEFFHVGGDEPQMNCWSANEDVAKYMADNNYTEIDLYTNFENRYKGIVEKHGKKVIGWREIGTLAALDPATTMLNVWDGNDKLGDFLADGYRAVISSNWYLNYGGDWSSYYADDPAKYMVNNTAEEKANMLGGEACMWASAFDTSSNQEPTIWPNAAAMAETLWSAEVSDDIDSVRTRLSQQRCRMVRRGVRASPIAEDYCGEDLYVRKSRVYYFPVNGFPDTFPDTPGP